MKIIFLLSNFVRNLDKKHSNRDPEKKILVHYRRDLDSFGNN